MNAMSADPELAAARAATGAGMDRVRPPSPRARLRRGLWRVAGGLAAAAAAAALWGWLPSGVAVARAEIDVAVVATGTFRDELASRATVLPLHSIVLDATEGGRVEAVQVRDGASVHAGDLLYRLSNPQRAQEVLARSADVAQQLANLSTLRAGLAAARLAQRREVAALAFEADRLAKAHARNVQLAGQGFISASALEESADRLAQQQRLLAQVQADGSAELATREQSVAQMDLAIGGLQQALGLVRSTAEALSARAPAEGRLTGFALQQGETVKPGDRLGRIDSLGRYKLGAQLDEFYLARLSPGLKGTVELQGRTRAITLARTDAEVKDGRFGAEFLFDDEPAPAGLQAGQTLDLRLTLGRPTQALLLADGPFYADSGGTWVYVLAADGRSAERRPVRLGRRAAGQVEVLGGLRPGDSVVVSGVGRFGDATRLRIEP